MGQEETKKVTLTRGTEKKQLKTKIEIINNNENTIENVKIEGTFPTKNNENNMDIQVIEGITLEGIEGAKVYYTEKENATTDLQNTENAWKETIEDGTSVRKYFTRVWG